MIDLLVHTDEPAFYVLNKNVNFYFLFIVLQYTCPRIRKLKKEITPMISISFQYGFRKYSNGSRKYFSPLNWKKNMILILEIHLMTTF